MSAVHWVSFPFKMHVTTLCPISWCSAGHWNAMTVPMVVPLPWIIWDVPKWGGNTWLHWPTKKGGEGRTQQLYIYQYNPASPIKRNIFSIPPLISPLAVIEGKRENSQRPLLHLQIQERTHVRPLTDCHQREKIEEPESSPHVWPKPSTGTPPASNFVLHFQEPVWAKAEQNTVMECNSVMITSLIKENWFCSRY